MYILGTRRKEEIAKNKSRQMTTIALIEREAQLNVISSHYQPRHCRVALDAQLFYIRREPRHSILGMGKV